MLAMKVHNSEKLAAAIGPYSHAVGSNGLIFTSGQLPTVATTGQVIAGGIEAQSRQALINLQALLDDAGSSMKDVLKVTVFLADINDFKVFNEIYAEFFSEHKPARSAFQVAALPLGALVEVECVAQCSTD